jgi:hypothetical protein
MKKLSLSLMMIPVVLLAGCSRPVVKETVVEKQPVVVERPAPAPAQTQAPAPAPAAAGASVPGCTYASQAYSHGSMSCQDRVQHRCDSGIWQRTVNAC